MKTGAVLGRDRSRSPSTAVVRGARRGSRRAPSRTRDLESADILFRGRAPTHGCGSGPGARRSARRSRGTARARSRSASAVPYPQSASFAARAVLERKLLERTASFSRPWLPTPHRASRALARRLSRWHRRAEMATTRIGITRPQGFHASPSPPPQPCPIRPRGTFLRHDRGRAGFLALGRRRRAPRTAR